jgi:RNA polymerase sigma factor (sigma-70 family)
MFSNSEIKYLGNLSKYADKNYHHNDVIKSWIKEYRSTKNPTILNSILKQFISSIISIVRRYKRNSIDIGDMIHHAIEGVIEAIELHYRLDSKEKFITYVYKIVERRVKDYLDEEEQSVSLPKNIRSQQGKIKSGKIKIGDKEFIYSKINIGNQKELKQLYKNMGLDEIIDPDTQFNEEDLQFDIKRILSCLLNQNEQYVIAHSFGLFGNLRMDNIEIAKKLNITTQGTGVIKARALFKLESNDKVKCILNKYLN